MVIAALVVAIVSAAAAVAAVVYARRLDGTAKAAAAAAERTAVASEARAVLYAHRRHEELTPQFRVSCQRPNPDGDGLALSVFLAGPPELGRLDSLTVRVRDDHAWRADGLRLAGGPSPEQVAAQIWGPYRFVPGSGPAASPAAGEFQGADQTGRVTATGGMPVGEGLPFALERTWPPRWSQQPVEKWRRERGSVLRLQLEARREGDEPWTLVCELDTAPAANSVEVP